MWGKKNPDHYNYHEVRIYNRFTVRKCIYVIPKTSLADYETKRKICKDDLLPVVLSVFGQIQPIKCVLILCRCSSQKQSRGLCQEAQKGCKSVFLRYTVFHVD